ncbi:MAG TPA: YceD family protein [Croceibacterium sp.]
MIAAEFAHPVDRRHLPAEPVSLAPSAEQCAALARRFGIVAIDRLEAELRLEDDGEAVNAEGRLRAAVVQSCAVSGEDLPVTIDEPLTLRFVPEVAVTETEIELEERELDEIPFAGHVFDLGEAVAQSLALAIDPYAVGPGAEQARKDGGLLDEAAAGPFAALAALKKSS